MLTVARAIAVAVAAAASRYQSTTSAMKWGRGADRREVSSALQSTRCAAASYIA
jgi:hypothetical protein